MAPKYRAQELAEWAIKLQFKDLPENVVRKIKLTIRDGLGCGLFGSTLQISKIMRDALIGENGNHGRAIIWGTDCLASPETAALINGTAVQSFEVDDICPKFHIHPSSSFLPVILAIADRGKQVSGKQMITAEAIGLEFAVQLSNMTPLLIKQGWHTPTLHGTIASAVVAGMALGLDVDRLTNCISLGVLQAGGLLVVQYEGMSKRFYAGRAAQSGLLAALLAEKGFDAPKDCIENTSGGFCSTFAQGTPYEIQALGPNLGSNLGVEGVQFKVYSSCGANHPALDALSTLRLDHPEIGPDTLKEITVVLNENAFARVGWDYVPKDVTTAQFNLAYSVAVFLLEGQAFINQYRPELLADPRVLDLVSRVRVVSDPELSKSPHKTFSQVKVHLKDGRLFEGSAYHGLRTRTDEDLLRKYNDLAAKSLPRERVDALASRIRELEGLHDVSALSQLTRA